MSRRRGFPLISTIIVLILGYAVVHACITDVDLPRRALSQIDQALSQLANNLRVLANSIAEGEFVFVDALPEEAFAAAGDEPLFLPGTAGEQLPLLVNAKTPLPEGYTPQELVMMRAYCDSAVVTIKGSEIEGERVAVDALMTMLRDAIAQGVSNWQISAGYRSVAYQQKLWDNKVYEYRQQGLSGAQAQQATAKYVAKPGSSEHHTGLAFDVTVPGESFPLTKQSKWLAEHCHEYGFVIRYTEEKADITGFQAEPWHIRYVGQPHARIMRENNWCLEEYVAAR